MHLKYPFDMCGRIERCWLFAFREPGETIAPLVPEPLTAITRDGYAFWNVVVCEISGMRPLFAPKSMGISYRHAAYRIYVRHKPTAAPPVEGLYFVRSDADSAAITAAGSLLTDFHFHRARIRIAQGESRTEIDIDSRTAPGHALIDLDAKPHLREQSPFGSLFEAKAVLKYKPFALAPAGARSVRVLRVRRDELAWRSKLVQAEADFEFFNDRAVEPEIAYQVDPIDYRWERCRSCG
mgnify:FL=1